MFRADKTGLDRPMLHLGNFLSTKVLSRKDESLHAICSIAGEAFKSHNLGLRTISLITVELHRNPISFVQSRVTYKRLPSSPSAPCKAQVNLAFAASCCRFPLPAWLLAGSCLHFSHSILALWVLLRIPALGWSWIMPLSQAFKAYLH